MNKIILILKREYFTRVKKRSFLLTTILVPLVIIGFYAAILAIGMSDTSAKERIAVLDEANLLDSSTLKQNKGLEWVFFSKQTEKSLIEMYDTLGFDHFLFIPKQEDSLAEISSVLHSKAVASFSTLGEIEDNLSESNRLKKLKKMGLDPVAFNKAMSDVKLTKVIDSKDGAKDQVDNPGHSIQSFAWPEPARVIQFALTDAS